jgi:hypothetical protein
VAGESGSAKQLRATDKKNKAHPGPKSELHHSKGSPKSGVVKAKAPKKIKKG